MTQRMHLAVIAFALCAVLTGCLEDESLRTNVAPVAVAGEDQELESDGAPVSVRLDGRKSSDKDGEVVEYIWRSGLAGDAGPQWASGALDPDDEARPELELELGSYVFQLWVRDDQGAVSKADSVMVEVAQAGLDPVAQCVAESLPVVAEACLACSCGTELEDVDCLEAVVGCRENCWGLINCIVMNACPTGDTGCIVTNCSAFLVGDAADTATAVGPCLTACSDDCM